MSSDAGEQGSANQPKVGAPFSQVYLRPSAPMKDSQRFRNRLSAYMLRHSEDDLEKMVNFLRIRSGAKELHTGHPSYIALNRLIKSGEMRDVLDCITYVHEFWHWVAGGRQNANENKETWHVLVEHLFEDEWMGYTFEESGGVRYKVEMEFERVRLAALAHLGIPRYNAVLHEFEQAYRAIEATPPDTKLAVRAMFEGIETQFKLMAGSKAKLLGSPEVKQFLPPMIRSLYADPLAANTMAQLVNGLADWVNGLQAYRHGQGVEEPSPPPMEAAVAALQTGSAYLRLLVELDRKVQSGSEDA